MSTHNKKPAFLLGLCALALGLAWLIANLNLPAHKPALDVWVLDVGQGESILLRDPDGKTLLFDGGPSEAVLSQLGAVLPPWQKRIDLVVLSHNHSDHIRGLIGVLERYQVGEVRVSGAVQKSGDYAAFRTALSDHALPPRITFFDESGCRRPEDACPPPFSHGRLTLQAYHPFRDATGEEPEDQHDDTVVLKATFGGQSLLLSGDLNEGHEEDMLATCARHPACTLHADILQIPHHGSASGLSPAFLASVRPRAAVIPVGADNKFHHPTQAVLTKLETAGVPVFRTDRQGRIHLTVFIGSFRVAVQRSG